MYLLIKELNNDLFDLSTGYFDKDYKSELKSKSNYKESIVSRYLVSKLVTEHFWIKDYLPCFDDNWKPLFYGDIHFSISHKNNLVFVWVSGKKIWLDIEVYKKREVSLLDIFSEDNYKRLWWKNWHNFYILWTSYESIIKYSWIKDIDTKKLIIKKIDTKNIIISWIDFRYDLDIIYNNYIFDIFSFSWENRFYSICYKNNFIYF